MDLILDEKQEVRIKYLIIVISLWSNNKTSYRLVSGHTSYYVHIISKPCSGIYVANRVLTKGHR